MTKKGCSLRGKEIEQFKKELTQEKEYSKRKEDELIKEIAKNDDLKTQLAAREILNKRATTFEALKHQEELEKIQAELTEQVRANKMLVKDNKRMREGLQKMLVTKQFAPKNVAFDPYSNGFWYAINYMASSIRRILEGE